MKKSDASGEAYTNISLQRDGKYCQFKCRVVVDVCQSDSQQDPARRAVQRVVALA